MEARSVSEIPLGAGWQHERKWDGFRCLAFRDGDSIELRAKSGKSLSRFFPDVVAQLAQAPARRFVLDGELIIPVDGEPSFDALQMRLHPSETRVARLAAETPASLMAFDCLADQSGKSFLERPFEERRGRLEKLLGAGDWPGVVLTAFTRSGRAAQAWLSKPSATFDGVVSKRLDLPYRPGERAMLKIKLLRTADCVVGGFRYATAGREVGSLLLGLYDQEGKLHHVGFTSSIKDAEKAELTRKLEALIEAPGFTGDAPGGPSRWSTERSGDWEPLKPTLVAEVQFDHVTGGRFRHGTRFLRWRPDKRPAQCTFAQLDMKAANIAAKQA
jgi:ATP-dependent DNA ligase